MADGTVYEREFAELYDLFHAAKDYRAEAQFIRNVAGSERTLLDVACGTGSHAIQLSRLGFEVTGVDISADMLKHARRKAREARQRINFERQDLMTLKSSREFDVVTCLFDSIGYLRTDARIRTALRNMRRCLRTDGLLFLEAWHAPAMLGGFDPLRVRRVRGSGLEAVRIGETRLLPAKNAAEVNYEVFFRRGGNTWRRFTETHVNRFFTNEELAAHVRAAGFEIIRILGGFDDNSFPNDDAWHLVLIARNRRSARARRA